MGQRIVRVSELVKREISDVLHTRFRSETVRITIADVNVAPDLRYARVYYSILGGVEEALLARRFFGRNKREIRKLMGKRIVLKYLPMLEFIQDDSIERGDRLNLLMDEMGLDGETTMPDDEFEKEDNY